MEKLKAVIYCRVSTSSDVQIESLEYQVAEARAAVKRLGYELVDEYVDEGESGTTSRRTHYTRLLKDMQTNKFDIIITKCLDRLNRNTYEWYRFVDTMVQHGKRLYFYLENSYYSPDEKLLLGIKAILADEFSRELSKKLNSAHHRRQREGSGIIITNNTYGYCRVADESGRFHIQVDPEEAVLIKRIFELAVQGYGGHSISNFLYAEGYRNRNGQIFGETTIRRIIKNPMYYGTVIMHKTAFDFETKKTIHIPESEWIYHEGLVPAIISKELWEAANENLAVRRKKYFSVSQKHSSSDYSLSGKIKCGECGQPYYVSSRKTKKGVIREWYCKSYYCHGRKNPELRKKNRIGKFSDTNEGCDNITIKESELIDILQELQAQLFDFSDIKSNIINKVIHSIKHSLEMQDQFCDEQQLQRQLDQTNTRLEKLLLKFVDGHVSEENYIMLNEKLEQEKRGLLKKINFQKEKKSHISQLESRLLDIREKIESDFFQAATMNSFISCVDSIVINQIDVTIYMNLNTLLELDPEHFLLQSREFHFNLKERAYRYTQNEIEHSMQKIIELIKEQPRITKKELAAQLHLSMKTLEARIKLLKEEGKIMFKGSGRHGRWEIL